jgi:hypothetical protein
VCSGPRWSDAELRPSRGHEIPAGRPRVHCLRSRASTNTSAMPPHQNKTHRTVSGTHQQGATRELLCALRRRLHDAPIGAVFLQSGEALPHGGFSNVPRKMFASRDVTASNRWRNVISMLRTTKLLATFIMTKPGAAHHRVVRVRSEGSGWLANRTSCNQETGLAIAWEPLHIRRSQRDAGPELYLLLQLLSPSPPPGPPLPTRPP